MEEVFVTRKSATGFGAANETADLARYVLYHHERFDGYGYPAGKVLKYLCSPESWRWPMLMMP